LLRRRHTPSTRPTTKTGKPLHACDRDGTCFPNLFAPGGHVGKFFRSAEDIARNALTVTLPLVSKRGIRRAATIRGNSIPGWRGASRISVGSFNCRSLKGDKFKLACHEFASRNFFICGVSEHWMSGSGALVDEQTGVRFVCVGHSADENSKSGKRGVGFLMSWKARGLWIAQGPRANRVESARES
jgi:hypothetical protein